MPHSKWGMDAASLDNHLRLLLGSYKRWTGRELLPCTDDEGSEVSGRKPDEDRTPSSIGRSLCERLDAAPFALLSHGTEADPVLNYGNRMALRLWEMEERQFAGTPSRLTAEPLEREQRARFMNRVTEQGYVEDYTGVRISSTGRRFEIIDAVVWNVIDEEGRYRGQAATFANFRYVD